MCVIFPASTRAVQFRFSSESVNRVDLSEVNQLGFTEPVCLPWFSWNAWRKFSHMHVNILFICINDISRKSFSSSYFLFSKHHHVFWWFSNPFNHVHCAVLTVVLNVTLSIVLGVLKLSKGVYKSLKSFFFSVTIWNNIRIVV